MAKINSTLGKLVEATTGGNKSKFAKMYLHDRPTNLENWIGGSKSPTVEKLEPMFQELENLNLNWFFRNKGEMYIDNNKDVKLQLELEEALKTIQQRDETIKFYEDIIRNSMKKDANFQMGDMNRLLVDDILMMVTCPMDFNKGFNIARPDEIN